MRWLRRAAVRASIVLVFAAPAAAQIASLPPTSVQDVAPILYHSCSSCHRPGKPGPFPLLTYDDAKKYAPQIAAALRLRAMPPWLPEHGIGNFANETRLTDKDIRAIVAWVKNGAPPGPSSETPPLPNFTAGWQLGPPDMILDAIHTYSVPVSGPDVFWNFIFSLQLSGKRYVRAIEVRSGIPHVLGLAR
jgi:mono/diheme cytochrome c family protein